MKSLSSVLLTLLIAPLFISCQNQQQSNSNTDSDFIKYGNEEVSSVHQENGGREIANNSLKYFESIDSKNGMVMSITPFPSSWQKQNSGDYAFTGPNGIKIFNEKGGSFMFSNDPQTNQMYQQSGIQVQFPKSIDQVINEGFMEYANKINRKLLRKYPIPQIAAWDKQFDDKLYKTMPSQKTFTVYGLEWQDPDGKMFLTVLHHFVSYDQMGGYWGIIYSVLETPEEIFAATKKQFLNGLINQQTNPQWVQVKNQQDQQTAMASNNAHQNRMNDIQAFGANNTARHNQRMAAMDQDMEKLESQSGSWRPKSRAVFGLRK